MPPAEGSGRDHVNHTGVLDNGRRGVGRGDRRVGRAEDDVARSVAEDVDAAGDREAELPRRGVGAVVLTNVTMFKPEKGAA